ncbi:MAG: hypothetical protein RLN99_16540, partial [Kiloniellaceae bacterium]
WLTRPHTQPLPPLKPTSRPRNVLNTQRLPSAFQQTPGHSRPWTYGLLANHVWSFAGEDDRSDVNATFLQPFLNYTFPSATTIFLNTETTYDWTAEEASVPINVGVNQLFTIGGQAFQIGAGLRYWADAPDGGPDDFGFRINLVALFPVK